MKRHLIFICIYFLFWVCWFVITKIVFLLYHYRLSAELDINTILLIPVNGLKLDLSITAYISVIPFFIISLSYYLPDRFTKYSINFYTIIILILASVLTVIDLELYTYWEYRLDATPLMYFKTPKEMFASVEMSQILLGVFFLAILISVSVYLFLKLPFVKIDCYMVDGKLATKTLMQKGSQSIIILFLTSCLIIPIRGGFQLAAINQSHVYFSKNSFANHAAVNVPWNFCHSIVERSFEKTNPYNYLPEEEARVIVQKLLKTHTNGLTSIHSKHPSVDNRQLTIDSFQSSVDGEQSIIANPKSKIVNPNVIIIILESFTSKLIQPLGGMEGITPNFNKLTKEGILFTNIYASGDRSDKGLPAILSGFPAQPARSIVMIPSKTANLPFINKIFKKNFYHTSFYYGGELEFANIKSYLINGEFDKIVGKYDFDPKDWNSKWGAHDHVVFNRLLDDLDTMPVPFFSTIFTLSSHEPFEIPNPTLSPPESEKRGIGETERRKTKPQSYGQGRQFTDSPIHPFTDSRRLGGGKGLDDEVARFLNVIHYTDWSLGEFIKQAKKKAWWHNTLIIITADHGHRLPGYSALHQREKFKIPMLWIGGAIEDGRQMMDDGRRMMGNGINKQVTIIDKIGSQTDIAKTLLNQIGFESKEFTWSKDLLAPESGSFAYYVFNDGFCYIDSTGYIIFDNISGNVIEGKNNVKKSVKRKGQAYLQLSFQEYLDY